MFTRLHPSAALPSGAPGARPAWTQLGALPGVVALLIAAPLAGLLFFDRALAGWFGLPWLGLALVAGAGAVLVRRLLWPRHSATTVVLAIAGGLVLAVVALYAGFLGAYVVTVSQELCGDAGHGVFAEVAGAAAYLLVGSWAFLRPGRLVVGWPLAVLVGIGVLIAVHAGLPGAHGYCET